jgi:hypothetical protein
MAKPLVACEGEGQLIGRVTIANAVASHAAATWREDVRVRRLAIAAGESDAHGEQLKLVSCVLGELPS